MHHHDEEKASSTVEYAAIICYNAIYKRARGAHPATADGGLLMDTIKPKKPGTARMCLGHNGHLIWHLFRKLLDKSERIRK